MSIVVVTDRTGGFMKKILLAAALIAVTAGIGFCGGKAAGAPKAGGTAAARAGQASQLDQVDAVDKRILDLDAMYWAWRVAQVKDVTYEGLEKLSERWVMKPATRQELFKKMKALLDGGKARPLDAGEKARYDAAKAEIRGILAPGSKDKALAKTLSDDYCVELDARYWAGRIQGGEKEILQLRENWAIDPGLKEKLFARMDENLKKEKNAPLTKDEEYKLDACNIRFQR